ncbi:MAG: class I SAM-dependent methyltransferase [Pseudomonadota bacterium]
MSYARAREIVLSMFPPGSTGAEIGVWQGDLSAEILRRARPGLLHLIDPWQARDDVSHREAWYSADRGIDVDGVYAAVCTRFAEQIADGSVVIHRAPSTEALAAMKDNSLDWIYIDGDHSFDAVSADLDSAYRVVKPGGLICADDYRLGKWWGDGVVSAVNAFIGANASALELRFSANTQVVLKKL